MPQGNKALGTFTLNGKTINAPIEWSTIEALATFDKEAVQANISLDKLTFANEEGTAIRQYIDNGLTGGVGIFEGLPLQLQIYNNINTATLFDGLIDLTDNLEITEWKNKVSCKLRLKDELLSLEEKLQSLTYGYLEHELKLFSDSDYTRIPYIVQKKINLFETITAAIVIYMLAKETIESIRRLAFDIANAVAHVTGGVTGTIAAAVLSIAVVIIDIAYSIALILALFKMASALLSQLIPVKRHAKTIKLKTALEKVCTHLGYGFNSNIVDLENTYFVPSNMNWDLTDFQGIFKDWKGTPKGIPNITDYGYNCSEMFELAKKLFNGKYAIINGVINFHNVDDLYWVQISTYKMPSVRDKIKTYNASELKANKILSFEVDFTDEHTINNYKGTSYETITDALVVNDIKYKYIKGLSETRFNVSLATRKDELSGWDSFLMSLAKSIDSVLGGNTWSNKIQNTVGLMIVGNNNYAKPKVVKVNEGTTRLVDRDNWSAKFIYDNYYLGTSFVSTVNGLENYGQKEIYNGVKIPFGINDFMLMINNSYFTTDEGYLGKIISCKYRFAADYATVDYFIRKPYTKNLKETYIEPTGTEND